MTNDHEQTNDEKQGAHRGYTLPSHETAALMRKYQVTRRGPVSPKQYACRRCGTIKLQSTNHWAPTWSSDRLNTCPACPPHKKYPEFGGRTIWDCLEPEPLVTTKEDKS